MGSAPSPVSPTPDDLNPFLQLVGLRLEEVDGKRVRGTIELGERQHTPWGLVHGGVYTTAIETAASIGASLAVRDQGMFAVGVTNTTDFVRPMRTGRVDVVAEPLTQGRTQQLWQVDIVRHDDGKRVAHGKVRLQNVPLDRDDI
jgi:1,4-dihydroxy-2-naphthoyl-CoA hydrolase